MTPTQYAQHQKKHRKVTSEFAAKLEPHKLTPMEAVALVYCPGQPMRDVAHHLGVTLPQITALTKKLESLKLIRLRQGKEDRREKYCFITDDGIRVLEQLEAGNE